MGLKWIWMTQDMNLFDAGLIDLHFRPFNMHPYLQNLSKSHKTPSSNRNPVNNIQIKPLITSYQPSFWSLVSTLRDAHVKTARRSNWHKSLFHRWQSKVHQPVETISAGNVILGIVFDVIVDGWIPMLRKSSCKSLAVGKHINAIVAALPIPTGTEIMEFHPVQSGIKPMAFTHAGACIILCLMRWGTQHSHFERKKHKHHVAGTNHHGYDQLPAAGNCWQYLALGQLSGRRSCTNSTSQIQKV